MYLKIACAYEHLNRIEEKMNSNEEPNEAHLEKAKNHLIKVIVNTLTNNQ